MNVVLAASVAGFFGDAFGKLYPNGFIAGLILTILIGYFLIKIQSPAPLTLMICTVLFIAIAGFSNSFVGVSVPALSGLFLPALILIFIIGGGIAAYAFWKLFGG